MHYRSANACPFINQTLALTIALLLGARSTVQAFMCVSAEVAGIDSLLDLSGEWKCDNVMLSHA